MTKTYFLPVIFLLLVGCATDKNSQSHLRWVGDIPPDSVLDDPEFSICHGEKWVKQYFHFDQGGLQYKGEQPAIAAFFNENYNPIPTAESGWVRIRFIVNCEGKTGRFRLMGSNEQYEPFAFDPKITNQLMKLTQQLDGWQILPNPEAPADYYQYLIFKIENGQIIEILP